MLSGKNIVVTIGNNGAVVALHEGNDIKNKIFLDELNDKTKEQLKNIFLSNKSAQIYVLLDTADQIYKKKSYPLVRRGDLIRLIRRDMASDGDKESLKNYIILSRKKAKNKTPQNNKWESLFVSASNTETTTTWVEFLLEMPNRLVGIYMLPIESFQLLKLLKKDIRLQSRIKIKRNDLYCLVIQNKVSGFRQIVFSESGIVFTRIVDYDFSQPDSLEKYEQDIYSTFEYLKRLFPDVSISELDIVNVLSSEGIEAIKTLKATELNFINYTPSQASAKIGLPNLLPTNSSSCDLLISKVFSKSNKLLKFSTPKISSLEKFFLGLRASYYADMAFIVATLVAIVFSLISQSKLYDVIEIAKIQKTAAIQEFARVQKLALEGSKVDKTENGEAVDIERVTDFGKIDQALSPNRANIADFYSNLKFIKNYNVNLAKFSYSLSGFNAKSPSANGNYTFSLNGKIHNKTGDIEDLFSEFDGLVAKTKETLKNNRVNYTDLPRNIDFNQKYYSFPIDFSISK